MQSMHHTPPHCQLIINQPNSLIRWRSTCVSPTQILESKDIQESIHPRANILDKALDNLNVAILAIKEHWSNPLKLVYTEEFDIDVVIAYFHHFWPHTFSEIRIPICCLPDMCKMIETRRVSQSVLFAVKNFFVHTTVKPHLDGCIHVHQSRILLRAEAITSSDVMFL